MNQITKETRFASYITRPQIKRTDMILGVMGEDKLTAREIAYRLGYSDLNAVKPRLTELMQAGVVQPLGKVKDNITGRSVTVWEVVND